MTRPLSPNTGLKKAVVFFLLACVSTSVRVFVEVVVVRRVTTGRKELILKRFGDAAIPYALVAVGFYLLD